MKVTTMVRHLSALLLVLASVGSHASVITFDFEDLSGDVQHKNYYSQGFRFSPNCHYDTMSNGAQGQALGWDSAGCEANDLPGAPPGHVGSNPDWLGPPELSPNGPGWTGYYFSPSLMYIDRNGADFSLFELDLVIADSRTFQSSNGGIFSTPNAGGPAHLSFHGAEWRNITWLLISGGGGVPLGIDNLVVQFAVPEPTTLALVSGALLGLAVTRRRRLASTAQ